MAWPSDTALGKNGRQPKEQTKGDGMILSPAPAKIVDNPLAAYRPQLFQSGAFLRRFPAKARRGEEQAAGIFSEKSACGVLFRVFALFPSRLYEPPGRETV